MVRWRYGVLHGSSRMLSKPVNTFGLSVFLFGLFALGFFVGVTWNFTSCEQQCVNHLQGQELTEEPDVKAVYIVLIFSAPQNSYARETIRRTWLQTKEDYDIAYLFVIGMATLNMATEESLYKENNNTRDLLFLKHVSDSYLSLTRKLLEALKWVSNHARINYVLKVDDDSFVRLDVLYNLLLHQDHTKFYWGFFDGRAPVHRSGKWAEENWNLCDTYLPYAKGGGYIISADLVDYIASNADLFTLYRSEDASLGAWLAPLNIHRLHDNRFDTEYKSRGCFNSYLITHKLSESMMITKYRNLLALGHMCPKEKRFRLSYVYNWKVPPSMCCVRNDSTVP